MSVILPNKSTAGYTKRVWSPEEDAILVENINMLGYASWKVIADLFPGRTGKQCRERWHNHLIDGGCKKGDWTTEDDELIMNLHSSLGNQWSSIAKALQGRSANDVKNRFYTLERLKRRLESNGAQESSNCSEIDQQGVEIKVVKNTFKAEGYTKKVWSPEEDNVLCDKIKTLGRVNWNVIASYLPERTGKQCRERYQHHLVDGIKKGDWTQEEDAIILSSHSKIGNLWAKISKLLPDRSSNDVRNRYRSLTKSDDSTCSPTLEYDGMETVNYVFKKRTLDDSSSNYTGFDLNKRTTSTDSVETNWSERDINVNDEISLDEGICCFHNFLKSLKQPA